MILSKTTQLYLKTWFVFFFFLNKQICPLQKRAPNKTKPSLRDFLEAVSIGDEQAVLCLREVNVCRAEKCS